MIVFIFIFNYLIVEDDKFVIIFVVRIYLDVFSFLIRMFEEFIKIMSNFVRIGLLVAFCKVSSYLSFRGIGYVFIKSLAMFLSHLQAYQEGILLRRI